MLWAGVANRKWHIESHYPTQAKGRLEWATQVAVEATGSLRQRKPRPNKTKHLKERLCCSIVRSVPEHLEIQARALSRLTTVKSISYQVAWNVPRTLLVSRAGQV